MSNLQAYPPQLRLYNSECLRSGRRFVGFEKNTEIFATATERIRAHLAEYPQEAAHERLC